jgi:CHAT domain-containing protein/Tfp pilus assembly protein PilF
MCGKRLAAVLALVTGVALARGETPPAGRLGDAALAALGVGAGAAGVPVPPYKRMLQGADAKRAQALEERIWELWAAGKFEDAIKPAAEVLALRQRAQGKDHWEASDAARQVETLRVATALSADKRAALARAPELLAEGVGLHSGGKYAEAETLLREALAVNEKVLGPGHPYTANAHSYLASILNARGRYAEAEPLYRKALAVNEKALGPGHPGTARCCNNLALSLRARGRYTEAEPLLRRALATLEAVQGPEHPATATACNNLALNLHDQGRNREAGPLCRRALAIREAALGPTHPDTAQSYSNLALLFSDQKLYREAEPLCRRALAALEKALGADHPLTATGYNNLAENLQNQGRHAEAELLHRKALAIMEAALGPDHPDTAQGYSNLAVNLETQGRYAEAEPLHRKALATRRKALGPGHPATASGYSGLAINLHQQGRRKEAELLLRLALAIRERTLGPGHPATARSYDNLAGNLEDQGRYAEAEPLHRKALAVNEKALGPDHPETAASRSKLGSNLGDQGRHTEAQPLLLRALAAQERELSPGHAATALTYTSLAANLGAQGRSQVAEPLLRRALLARETALGRTHPKTAQGYGYLATCLEDQGRCAEAEPLWRAAADGLEASRLRLAASSLDRAAAAAPVRPHLSLAACRARLGRGLGAWEAAEAGLARGLLDDIADRATLPPDLQRDRHARERAARLEALDSLLPPLVAAEKPSEADRRRREELLKERGELGAEIASEAAELSRRAVLGLARVRASLAPDEALIFWLDQLANPSDARPGGDHWGCVVRRVGEPAWVRLPGSGEKGAWTEADLKLPGRVYEALALGEADYPELSRRLAAQRIAPLALHLAATADLPTASRLVVVPFGLMAFTPVEALSERYLVSYAPSGTVLARLREKHRALQDPTLLAVGDPNFALPGGNAPVGASREWEILADSRDRSEIKPLPGSRLEVQALAALLPGKAEVLLGSDASEQRLDTLAASGKLKDYRLIHLATHGDVYLSQAGWSALLLARDKLLGPDEQARLAAAGKKVYTGRLTVETIAKDWQLDSDLVTLSACQTALGPSGGGEGLLGFSQVLLGRGARSVLLSLWRVDDTATALLMVRFYQNLLGKREGLKGPLPKAQALREAKQWLRALPRAEAEALAARLGGGELRAGEVEARPVARADGGTGDAPYAQPRYWAAFILIGDPD